MLDLPIDWQDLAEWARCASTLVRAALIVWPPSQVPAVPSTDPRDSRPLSPGTTGPRKSQALPARAAGLRRRRKRRRSR
ncbi:hypothetical protein [Actinoplanes utahensis]|uniref:hypothetical protein n=1 Tax=Actinoplanes utahensis TaxID=1869 RepID=UPI001269DF7D|nr:hypothetical protein [Actinoplanes utahensis]GIF27401.1 hypothetical protein Aut01nite_03870 [Actinoplanes utahensis]